MKRIILVGRAASGKDYARKLLCDAGFTFAVSYTTRAPRPREVPGSDYNFISHSQFNEMTENKLWYEHVPFQGNQYGTLKSQMKQEKAVFIMSPTGLRQLAPEERKQSFVIYFNPTDREGLAKRLKSRGWSDDKIVLRMKHDDEQFNSYVLDSPGIEISELPYDPVALVERVQALF